LDFSIRFSQTNLLITNYGATGRRSCSVTSEESPEHTSNEIPPTDGVPLAAALPASS